jgi:hypothetical protein
MTDKAQSETHSWFWQKETKTIYFLKLKTYFFHNKQSLILILIHDVLQSEIHVNIMQLQINGFLLFSIFLKNDLNVTNDSFFA